jgi:hypothetical protein
MRAFALCLAVTVGGVGGVGACIATPPLEQIGGDVEFPAADANGDAANAAKANGDGDATGDGGPPTDEGDASVDDDDAATLVPDASFDGPLDPVCPPAGAPGATACCGAGNASPACIGMACSHCNDCLTVGCPAGMICCAISPGKSGKYKGMTCAAVAAAGACP